MKRFPLHFHSLNRRGLMDGSLVSFRLSILSLSLCLSAFLYVSVTVSVFLSLSVSLSVSVDVWWPVLFPPLPSLSLMHVCQPLCLSHLLYLSLSVSVCLSIFGRLVFSSECTVVTIYSIETMIRDIHFTPEFPYGSSGSQV